MDTERLIYQLIGKDNWESIDEVDSFLWVFDRMPERMKLIVDFRIEGLKVSEIAQRMKTTENNVRVQLCLAKKRICECLF